MKKMIFSITIIFCLFFIQRVNSQENNLKSIEIQSDIVETLINYHLCYYIDCSELKSTLPYLPFKKEYFNETSIKELSKILGNVWEDKEKEKIAKEIILNGIENEKSSIEAILHDSIKFNVSKRRKNLLKLHLDSLNNLDVNFLDTFPQYVSEYENIILEIDKYKVPDEIVILSGFLGSSEFISILKKAVTDSLSYNTFLVKLALSRFLIEPYHDEIIKMITSDFSKSYFKKLDYIRANELYDYARSILLYINSQKSVKEFSKLLNLPIDISNELIESHDDVGFVPLPYIVLEDLLLIIKNEDFKIYFLEKYNKKKLNASMFSNEDIVYALKWLEREYGNYILERDFFPGNIK